jgi:putative inorganic carbon (hco3(-)) transporter
MHKIINSTLVALTISIPLIFTTINYELFEFPKFILLLVATIIIAVAWIIDLYPNRKMIISSLPSTLKSLSPISLAILTILSTQFLATIFSIDPHTSFWGYYSRFHQGLLTTTCYTLIYFSAHKYLDYKSTQKLIKISIGTAILVSLYAIAQRFGIDKTLWVQDVVNRPFSTLGQPNWLSAYLIPQLFLTLFMFSTKLKKSSSIIFHLIYSIIFAALLLTKSRSGLIAFTFSYVVYWALLARSITFPKIKKPLIIFTTLSLLFTALIGTAYSPSILPARTILAEDQTISSGTQLESGGTESGDIRKIVWTGALDLIKREPLLGTGPESFAYSYYWTRPAEHNLTSEWDFLYNKAHNEYLNFAATTGLLGLTAYLFWHFAVMRSAFTLVPKSKKARKDQENSLRAYYPVLGASLTGFFVTNFFGFSVIPVYLTMILLSALPATIQSKPTKSHPTPTSHWLPLITISCILIIIFPLRLFMADLAFNKGKAHATANSLEQARTYLERAITLRPGESLYHSFMAETYAQMAAATSSQADQALAIREIKFTSDHNPWHLNYSKSRTKAWLALTTLDPTFYNQAALELENARLLAPSDPKLAYNLGLIYSRTNQVEGSIREMKAAIDLKPDYYQPYYALTLLYETTKQTNLVLPLLEQAESNITPLPEPLQTKLDLYSSN